MKNKKGFYNISDWNGGLLEYIVDLSNTVTGYVIAIRFLTPLLNVPWSYLTYPKLK